MEESIISFSSGILEVTRLVVIVLDVVFFLFFIYALFKVIPYRLDKVGFTQTGWSVEK